MPRACTDTGKRINYFDFFSFRRAEGDAVIDVLVLRKIEVALG